MLEGGNIAMKWHPTQGGSHLILRRPELSPAK